MKKFNYSNLTLKELIDKIEFSRFFNLPKMVAEALKKLTTLISSLQEQINSIPSQTTPNNTYKALLNKENLALVIPTVLQSTIPSDIVVSYNQFLSGGDLYTDIVIEHKDTDNIFVPLYFHQGSPFDDSVKMYKHEFSTTQTLVRIEFPVEDSQLLINFPFTFEVYR